ncbi:TPA: hypothetical protein EYN09_21685 [Candidatus Poribacteria bacterium]|nr:hypothetical protein [Candidatus Poribacteria bacterium]
MGKTVISIKGDMFFINNKPTYEGRVWQGKKIEGLLLNSRMVQGIFDDLNPETADRWVYPDTGKWDPERNTQEFLDAMPDWRAYGLLCFNINLQGGSPEGYSKNQPWHNSAVTEDGMLRLDYMNRLEKIMDRADELGMVVNLGVFYFGQDQQLLDESAVIKALDNTIDWILGHRYQHVLLEINNECNVRYNHQILQPERVHELISHVIERTEGSNRLLVSTSYGGGTVAKSNVVQVADYVLMHGNGVKDPNRISQMVDQVRQLPVYTPKPIMINEDDHFKFDLPKNNMLTAISSYCSWGYFDPGQNDYEDGFQSVPTQWKINTPLKKSFFKKVGLVSGMET